MSKNRKKSGEQATTIATQLRLKLESFGVQLSGDRTLDRLPVDMTDVYLICSGYQGALNRLLALSNSSDSRGVLEIISELQRHLYVHLPYHYKALARGLAKLEKLVEPDDGKRERLALDELRDACREVRALTSGSKAVARRRKRNT